MSLTDIMSGANLDVYAQVALVAFIVAFALIVWRVFSRQNAATYERARLLPLGDESPFAQAGESSPSEAASTKDPTRR